MLRRSIVPIALVALAVGAGCGGGGGGSATPPAPAPAAATSGPAGAGRVILQIPNKPVAAKNRKPQFVSTAAMSAVTNINGTTSSFDVSSTSTLCTPVSGGRTCTLAVTVPAGTTSVAASITITDAAAGLGVTLGIGSGSTSISPGATSFSFNIDISPVISTASASFTWPNGLTRIANGNVETGTAIVSYYDPDLVPVPSTSSSTFVTPLTLTSSDPNITISPASITNATQAVSVIYNGTPLGSPSVTFTLKAGATTLGSFPLQVTGYFTEYAITTPSSLPLGITVGSDGGLWFAESTTAGSNSNIARIDPITHVVAEYPIPRGTAVPQFVAPAPAPNTEVWFNESNPGIAQIGKVDPSGVFNEYGSSLTQPRGLVAANGLMWLAGSGPDEVISFDPMSGMLSGAAVTLPGGSAPTGIALDTLGKLWVTCSGNNTVVEIDPTSRTILSTQITVGAPFAISAGSDNAMWFTENFQNRIGRVTIGATPLVTEFPLPSGGSIPAGIALGPDGAMWFTENGIDKIGRIDLTSHGIVQFPITGGAQPSGIVNGPDGFLWFTENNGNKIGRMQT